MLFRSYKLCYRLGWAAGTAGSGDYLIALPTGVTFNTASGYNPTYTGTIWSPNVNIMASYVIPYHGGIVQSNNWNNASYILPYSSTTFRVLITNNLSGGFSTWGTGGFYPVSTEGLFMAEFEIWR